MKKNVSIDYFQDKNKFYRVVHGDAAAQDIQKSGEVRSAQIAGVKPKALVGGKINYDRTGATKWPSFAKGAVMGDYVAKNPNHYIIETDTKLSPSTRGRHSRGITHFPPIDPKTGEPRTGLPASEVKMWKHIGEGKYEPVKISPNATTPPISQNTSNVGLGLLGAALTSSEQAAKEGKDVYKIFGGGWGYSSGRSPSEELKIASDWINLSKNNPQYFKELQKLSSAKKIESTSTLNHQLPYQISDLLRLKK